MRTVIKGVGGYLPERVLTIAILAFLALILLFVLLDIESV